MDDPKAIFAARKAKANAELREKLEARRQKIAYDRERLKMRFSLAKRSAITEKALENLENPSSRMPSTFAGRPADQLVFKPEIDEQKNIAFFKQHEANVRLIERFKQKGKSKGKGPSP
jgi:hypothetical protein